MKFRLCNAASKRKKSNSKNCKLCHIHREFSRSSFAQNAMRQFIQTVICSNETKAVHSQIEINNDNKIFQKNQHMTQTYFRV